MKKTSILQGRITRRAAYVLDADVATAWARMHDDDAMRAADPRRLHTVTVAGEPLTAGHLETTVFDLGERIFATTVEYLEVVPGRRVLLQSLDQVPNETEMVFSEAPGGRSELDVRLTVLTPIGWDPIHRWWTGRKLRGALGGLEDVLKRLFPGT